MFRIITVEGKKIIYTLLENKLKIYVKEKPLTIMDIVAITYLDPELTDRVNKECNNIYYTFYEPITKSLKLFLNGENLGKFKFNGKQDTFLDYNRNTIKIDQAAEYKFKDNIEYEFINNINYLKYWEILGLIRSFVPNIVKPKVLKYKRDNFFINQSDFPLKNWIYNKDDYLHLVPIKEFPSTYKIYKTIKTDIEQLKEHLSTSDKPITFNYACKFKLTDDDVPLRYRRYVDFINEENYNKLKNKFKSYSSIHLYSISFFKGEF